MVEGAPLIETKKTEPLHHTKSSVTLATSSSGPHSSETFSGTVESSLFFPDPSISSQIHKPITSDHRFFLDILPVNHPVRQFSLWMTARHLSRRFVERSDIEDLNNAITCQREALSICFPGQNDTSEGDDEAIHTLAVDLNISEETSEKSRFQALAKLGGLDEESESYADWTSHRRRYSDLLEDLAAFLVLRFEDTTQIQDIDEAIDLRRQLLQLPSTMRNGGNIASLLNRLGDALVLRFKEQGRLEDLDEAVDCQTKVLSICADDDSRRPEFLESITDALILRFAKQGRTVTEDIDAAIDRQRELVALQSEQQSKNSSLNVLAVDLMLRYQKSARLEDLDESIEIFGRGLSSDNYSDPSRNKFLRGYAGALQTRFELQDKLGDLELSIKYYRESLALSPTESASRDGWHTSDPGRAQSLYGLGAALRLRFEHSSSTVDLDDAIIFQREAVALEPNNAAFIGDLGASLFGRYQSTGQMEDFDQAVDCQRQALTLEPSQRFYWLNNLAGMHLKRYGMTGQIEDRDLVAHGQSEPSFGQTNQQDNLDKAIACFRECVDIAPSDRYRMVALVNLASAIHTRFERCGVLDDLEEATACHREAAQVGRLALGLNSTVLLGNFAAILTTRYKLFGRMADLEESIKITREALTLTPPNHIDHAMYLNNLGQYLISRYQQKKQLDDLEEAIRSLRSSLSLRTIGHDDYHTTLNLLASALYLRFTLLKQLADLEESITVYRETMTLGRTQSPNHWAAMYNLATALKSRYKTLHQVEDQEEVLELCQRAVAVFRPSHPRLSAALQSLALICIDQGKLEQAFSLFKEAVNLPNSPLNDRLGCAREWAHIARNAGHSSALDAYVKSLELLDLCLASTPTMDLQHQLLAAADTSDDVPDISYLASNSASYAIQAGKLQMAVEMLEQGRALLWSRMRGYRHPLEKLRQVNPRLANDFEETDRLLAKLAVASDMDTTGDRGVQFDDQITRNRELSGRFEKIISDIRETEGFATFLKATPFDSLQRAAENGPVVLVNVDRYRSDALILSSLGPPLLVPLPNNLPDAIDKLSSKLFKMDLTARNTDRYDATHQLSTGDMGTILRLLWVSICKPVSSVLQTMEIPVGSRVWWCPIGKLGTLPLHASGRYEDGVLLEGFSDLYISSYIPTLSSLIASRESATKPIAQLRLLGVGQSNALSSVEGEFKTIREVFPGGIQLRDRADAIPETIIADLQEHPWVHFACHGSLNATSPFESGFVLHNNSRLSLRQIMQAKLSNAELAFLAACHSAAAESKAPNEVLSLAAAMQFCGFKSIVGTLWTMDDKDGPVLAEAFYKHMLRNGVGKVNLLDSAQAVHLATKAMRGAGVPFHRWTTFIHLGV